MGEIKNIGNEIQNDEVKVEGFFRAHVGWTAVGSAVSAALVVLTVVAWFHIGR